MTAGLARARSRVATLYRARMNIERQDEAGVWQTVATDVPCSIKAQRGQPPSGEPDAQASGQRITVWRVRCATGTGLTIGDRLSVICPDYGLLTLTVGSVAKGSLTVSETAYALHETWAAEGISLTLIRYDQTADEDVTFGPYMAQKLAQNPRGGTSGDGASSALITVSLRFTDLDASVEVGDQIPELHGGVVIAVRRSPDGPIEADVRMDAGATQ